MPFILGDCLPIFSDLSENYLDAIVDDPPAGIGFMGRSWDKDRGGREKWIAWLAERKKAQLRACKPGAYSLTWALPRTSHWTATALEDAGWLIRDVITHVQGQGWPKNGETQLKPAAEHWILAQKPIERRLTVRGNVEKWGVGVLGIDACRVERGAPIAAHHGTSKALFGQGGSTPYRAGDAGSILNELGSWPTNVLLSHCPGCEERGTRAVSGGVSVNRNRDGHLDTGSYSGSLMKDTRDATYTDGSGTETIPAFDCVASCLCGASVLHPSGGDAPRCGACGEAMTWMCPVAEMDAQSGVLKSGSMKAGTPRPPPKNCYGKTSGAHTDQDIEGSEGGASRFFPVFHYSAKASTAERDAGCEHLFWKVNKRHPFGFERVTLEEWRKLADDKSFAMAWHPHPPRAQGNVHPTVKPLDLCEWLLNLVLPRIPGYTEQRKIGDGFTGSGSIPIQAWRMGHDFVATDVSPEALEIARARLNFWQGGLHVQPPSKDRPKSRKSVLAPAKRQEEPIPEQVKIPGT